MASHPSPSLPASPPASKMPRLAEEEAHPGAAASPVSPPAGFIFMCSGATKPDCYRHQVLGLPRGRLDAVSRIRRGAALFLYDFDIKHLHGPYRAVSDGGLDLVPYAFHGRFPAQVKFKIEGDFMPLRESILKSAIKENYLKGKFSPELNSTQVEKLRVLFEPIPESAPPHYVNDRPSGPVAYLPPPASHPEQPTAYPHYLTAYVPPPPAHLVPPESYAPPCSYLAPPIAQPITHAYSVTTTGYGYQAGYEAYGPVPSTYQYAQVHPSYSQYTQYSMSEHVSAPVYPTGPYCAAYQNDPYQPGNVTSNYQQSTYERAAYDAGDGTVSTNLQLVRHYGSNPSSLTAASEAAATNLPIRRYGFTPSDATGGTTRTSDVSESQLAVTYTTHASSISAHRATSLDYAYSTPAASQVVVSPVISLPPRSAYDVATTPAYQ
ncbi:hypothetical protein EJB05_27050, partial [Eragrostis curvula]